MKNLITKSIAITLLIVSIFSCSSTPESINVKAKSTKINGELSPYYQIVDSSYSIAYKEYGLNLKIQLKRTNEAFDFDFDIKEMTNFLNLYCDIYDKEGAPVHLGDAWNGRILFDSNSAYNLIDVEQGKTGWIEFSLKSVDKDKFDKISTFLIRSRVDYEGIKQHTEYLTNKAANNLSGSSSTSSADNEVSKNKSGSKNWDKILVDYEAYTDKYIKLLKKANAGDASAMTEYMEMLTKAQEFQESLADADDDLTPAQLQKFTKIQMKLANAAAGGL